MTTLGTSPPRSKKGSSAASNVLTAGSIVAALADNEAGLFRYVEPSIATTGTESSTEARPPGVQVPVDDDVDPKVAARRERDEAKAARRQDQQDAKQAKRRKRAEDKRAGAEAKQARRQERTEARRARLELTRKDRAERTQTREGVAAAEEQEGSGTRAVENEGLQTPNGLISFDGAGPVEAPGEAGHDSQQRPEAAPEPEPATRPEVEEATLEERRRRDEAKRAARQERDEAGRARAEAKEQAKREQAVAKEQAKAERAEVKAAVRKDKAAKRSDEQDDHIVEPPREPKVPIAKRLRRKDRRDDDSSARSTDLPDPPSEQRGDKSPPLAAAVAGVVGAIGLVCSLVLAMGALMVAVGAGEGNNAYETVTSVCDVLVGPLRDVFTFSGGNADMKQSLVAWGLGSMGYLLVGLFAQSFLRSRLDE